MPGRPATADLPAAAQRPRRAAAVVVLILAVAVLHGGLISGLIGGQSPAGQRAWPVPSSAAPVRVLDLVASRAAVSPVDDVHQTVVAAAPRIDAAAATSSATGQRNAERPRQAAERPSRSMAPSARTVVAVPAEPGAAPNSALAAPAALALPAAPRDDAPMPADPPPVYATRTPPPATLRYTLHRGDARGEATLRWQNDGSTYELVLQALLPQGATLEQRSQGEFDHAGLAPLRLADRRRGRSAQAVNFQRPQGRITFSGPRWEFPLVPGVQDRLSWLVQLVAIASATPLAPGDEVAMQVVGARGATSRWRFRVDRDGTLSPAALRLVREPEHLYDLRIELWLDPARGHWPLRLRQAQVPGGETLEWVLEDGPTATRGT